LGFVSEFSHELWSASHHPFDGAGGCPMNLYWEAFIRLSGFRNSMPRESFPF
jgi:hypothetical protein